MEPKTFPDKLHFHGPYKFIKGDQYLFDSRYANDGGIYIWTLKDEINKLNLVEYIGQTESFAQRQKYHLIQILGLNYRIISASSAKKGELDVLWDGLWRKKNPVAITELLDNYEKLNHEVKEYVELIDIYFAPTLTLDNTKRCHLEGCLGWAFRNNNPEDVTKFYPADNHLGVRAQKYDETIEITMDDRIEGISQQLNV